MVHGPAFTSPSGLIIPWSSPGLIIPWSSPGLIIPWSSPGLIIPLSSPGLCMDPEHSGDLRSSSLLQSEGAAIRAAMEKADALDDRTAFCGCMSRRPGLAAGDSPGVTTCPWGPGGERAIFWTTTPLTGDILAG